MPHNMLDIKRRLHENLGVNLNKLTTKMNMCFKTDFVNNTMYELESE